jgi:hypothetical protein
MEIESLPFGQSLADKHRVAELKWRGSGRADIQNWPYLRSGRSVNFECREDGIGAKRGGGTGYGCGYGQGCGTGGAGKKRAAPRVCAIL